MKKDINANKSNILEIKNEGIKKLEDIKNGIK